MTPGALAAAERVKPPSMTRVLASLSDLGMIERAPHPTDGRQAIVTLAPAGEEVIVAEHAARLRAEGALPPPRKKSRRSRS